MTFAPARTTLENSDTANKVLLTYVSLTSSVITSATSESMGLRAGAGPLVVAMRAAFNASLDYIGASGAPQLRRPDARAHPGCMALQHPFVPARGPPRHSRRGVPVAGTQMTDREGMALDSR